MSCIIFPAVSSTSLSLAMRKAVHVPTIGSHPAAMPLLGTVSQEFSKQFDLPQNCHSAGPQRSRKVNKESSILSPLYSIFWCPSFSRRNTLLLVHHHSTVQPKFVRCHCAANWAIHQLSISLRISLFAAFPFGDDCRAPFDLGSPPTLPRLSLLPSETCNMMHP